MKLSMVVPCFNEEGNIVDFCNEAKRVLTDVDYEIIFINDGSKDQTCRVLKERYAEKTENITIINFSRNFGKEAAMYAGLQEAGGEYTVIIDADLQQPLETVKEMVTILDQHPEYDEVAAYQEERIEGKLLTFFKRQFYKIINKLCDVELYQNASDFRCMRRVVVEAILNMSESFRFSKGIFAWIGFETYFIPYQVRERNAGTTSWSFIKLLKYAVDGIISFSTKPLKIAAYLGTLVSSGALIYMVFVIIQKLCFGIAVPGYATIVTLILFLGGVQLVFLGVIGEYLSRVHIEVKNRPIYITKEHLSYKDDSKQQRIAAYRQSELRKNMNLHKK